MPLGQLFDDEAGRQRAKVAGIAALLIAANAAAWGWAIREFSASPALLGTAFLAYSFGLRHAVDVDHIAAIDNVVRKLMQEGLRPLSAGLFFSLGHSTVVVLATLAIAATATAIESRFGLFKTIGALIGTMVSALFLLTIGSINLMILLRVWRSFQHVRRGGQLQPEHLDVLLGGRGFLAVLFRWLFHIIRRSWHMYPLGFLFGLGFDTATEIGLLAISAAQAAQGMSLWSMLIFPALFTAGMALVDTIDGVFMVEAYGWAFANPIRKLLQPDNHGGIGRGRCSHRQHRGPGPPCGTARSARRLVDHGSGPERIPRHLRVRDHRGVRRLLVGVGPDLSLERSWRDRCGGPASTKGLSRSNACRGHEREDGDALAPVHAHGCRPKFRPERSPRGHTPRPVPR
jgi:high-affinity nickel-transport protein